MELQTTDLDHESQYILDCCSEDETIDNGSYSALRLFGDRPTIVQIIKDTPVDLRGPYPWRMSLGDRLAAYGAQIIAQMPIEDQGVYAAASLVGLIRRRNSSAEYLASSAISDLVEGGWCQPFHRPPRSKDRLTPYGKDLRRLMAPAWIRRYVKRDEHSQLLRRDASIILERTAHIPPSAIVADFAVIERDSEALRRRRMDREAIARAGLAVGMPLEEAVNLPHNPGALKKYLRVARKDLRAARKSAKKAALMAERIAGAEAVSKFVKGERVEIMGASAGYAVRSKRSSVYGSGHGALDIDVLSPERVKLGELCFYVEDTPVIDQMIAIALHCAAGDELEILEIANVISVTPEGAGHPLLAGRGELPVAQYRIIDAGTGREFIPETPREKINMRNAAYYAETGALWRECLGIHMFGRKTKMVERLVPN